MGIDGISMAQLGLHRDMTSAQLANQVEQAAQQGLEFKIQDIASPQKDSKIEIHEDGGGAEKQKYQKKSKQEENEENEEEQKREEEEKILSFSTSDLKNFSVRANNSTGLIELYDRINNRVIEEITPEELMFVIKRINGASGIMVNKKI